MIINIFITGSLQQLWSAINTQQIIVLLPLFNVLMPANAAYFFSFIMLIASFDIFPVEEYYDDWFGMEPVDPLDQNFDSLGFESMYFMHNLGSFMIAVVLFPVFVLFYYSLFLCKKSVRAMATQEYVQRKIFWSHSIRTLYETYSMICICAMINSMHLRFNNFGAALSSIMAISMGVLCFALPFRILQILCSKFDTLNETKVKESIGELYVELNLEGGKMVLLYPFFFFLRRFLLTVTIIYQDKLIWQVGCLAAQVIAVVILIGRVDVFADKNKYRVETFNEVIIMMMLYLTMCFSDFVPEPTTRETVGIWSCCSVGMHLFVNLLVLFLK